MDAQVVGLLLSPPVLFLLGLCIGSFLNVVIHRLPLILERGWKIDSADMLGVKIDDIAELTLSKPRSRCPSCGHQIRWFENIPVLSYAGLRREMLRLQDRDFPTLPVDRTPHWCTLCDHRMAVGANALGLALVRVCCMCWLRWPELTGTPRCCPTT